MPEEQPLYRLALFVGAIEAEDVAFIVPLL